MVNFSLLAAAGIAFLFSASLRILSGIYPALRAAELEPIEALRDDQE